MRKIFSFLTAILFAGSMMATNYELVTSASQLQAGAKYVIGTATGKFMSTTSNASNRRITDGTITENVVEGTETMMVFTLGGKTNAWTFATDNYLGTAGYLNATNSTGSNYLKVVADLDDYAYFTIDIADGVTTVTCNGKTSRNILYLNGTTCFACYNTQSSAQYIKPNLYKEVSDTPTPLTTVKTVYCKNLQSWWNADGAAVGVYAWTGDVNNAAWPGVRMEAVTGEEGLWKADIDTAKYAKIIFTRVNATGDIADWGAKTADLTVPADKDLYTITSTSPVWGDPGVTGEWSVYGDDPTPGPEPPTPVKTLPVVALAGTMNAWAAANMTAADDSLSASIKVALEAKAYEFKIVSDGKWLSLNGEGESLYAFHRDWTSASHINGIDLRNFELTADVAGEYTFTWTYADSTLAITFPAKPQPVDDKIIFEWTKGTGAKVEADKTDLNANNMGTMTIGTFVQARLLGTNAMDNNAKGYKMGNNDVCVEIQGTKAFAVGDTVIITGVCGGSGARAFAIAPNTTINAAVDTALTNTQENTSDILEYKVIVKEAQAGDTMRIFRQAGKSMYLYSIKVVRPGDTPEPPVAAKFYVTGDSALVTDAGFAGKAWNPAAIKAEADTLVLNLKAEQVYKLKVTLDGTWNTAKGFNNLSETPAGLTMDNDENIIFSLAEAGAVKVIYIAGETPIFKLIGNFYVDPTPVDPTVAVKGSMNNWGDSIPFVLAQDKKSASLTANIKKGNYEFKMIINGEWRSNGYTYHRDFPGCAGITANVEANMVLQLDVDGDYTFTWTFENDSLGIVFPNKPIPVLENGYYLVGDKYDWTPAATRMFVENTSAAGEYILADITLAADDSLKVVKVEDDEIITWYPGGDNYVVDANHAGVKTIYFRADGQGGEGWYAGCIYVAPNDPTAITNVNADAKAVKSLKNGILMIEKDGKVYNVIGLKIR